MIKKIDLLIFISCLCIKEFIFLVKTLKSTYVFWEIFTYFSLRNIFSYKITLISSLILEGNKYWILLCFYLFLTGGLGKEYTPMPCMRVSICKMLYLPWKLISLKANTKKKKKANTQIKQCTLFSWIKIGQEGIKSLALH